MKVETNSVERLPESELEIMLILWRSDSSMTAGEITKMCAEGRGWKSATVHVLLERLAERGFVSCDKSHFRHLYSPIITEAEYRKGEEKTLMRRFFEGSAKNMIASLLNADGLSDADLQELSDMIRDRKEGKQ